MLFALLGTLIIAACGIFPEHVSMDDPRLTPMFAAMDRDDWTARGFTPIPKDAGVTMEIPPEWRKAHYDVMLHIGAASSRTISFRKNGNGYVCTGEQEIHEGPNSYTTVDGTFREEICITYETERVSGYPLNRVNVTYEGDDPKLNGHDLKLAEVLPLIRKWDEMNAR